MVEDLKDVLPRYYNIGEKLGLPSSTLREIMNENLDSYSAMTLIIKCWLKDRDRCKDLTWKSLVEAVAHKKGGNNVALAMKLTDKHRGKGSYFTQRWHQISPTIVSIKFML